jgi:hypothetical protein
MWMSPEVIVSSPATMRNIVDLPQPEGPTMTMNSPSRSRRRAVNDFGPAVALFDRFSV